MLIYCCEIHQGVCHLRPSTWGRWSWFSFLSPWLPISTTEHSVWMRHWVTLDKSVSSLGPNACVLPKFICWKPNPQSNDFRKWDHWKMIRSSGRAHMNGIRALMKEAWNTCSFLLFRDMSWKRPSLTQPCWHPDLGLLASRTVINNVVYIPLSLWHSVKAACVH